jgi:hypothetical protein
MPYLRWIVISFSQRRPGFSKRVVPKEYAVKNMIPVLGQVCLPILPFPCQLSFHYRFTVISMGEGKKKEKKNLQGHHLVILHSIKILTQQNLLFPQGLLSHTHTHISITTHTNTRMH